MSAAQEAGSLLANLDAVIDYMEATSEESWAVDVVRSKDGSTNCFFGHLFEMGGNDRMGSALWDMFEEMWSTTYMVYPINDGENPNYPEPTPKQRVIAFLRNLNEGKEMTTHQSMDAEFEMREKANDI